PETSRTSVVSALASPQCHPKHRGHRVLRSRNQGKPVEALIMNPRRMAVEMWPTLVFGGGLAVLVACIGSAGSAGAVRAVDRIAPSLAANAKTVIVPPRMAATGPAISNDDIATAAELLAEVAVDPIARQKQATGKQETV